MSIQLVQQFNLQFGLPDGQDDVLTFNFLNQDYRLRFILEECTELQEALDNEDRVAAFDALLDLVYVATGTALYMGINPAQWDAGMEAVHKANMSKVRQEGHRRGAAEKIAKPSGWVGPEEELKEILG